MNNIPLIKEKINLENLPKHVAIIMDGNGRWAKSKGEDRTFGHKNAIGAVRNAINACNELEIPFLTLYTFSSENWNRPNDEVSTLMNLLSVTLLQEAEEIFSKGLRLHMIGDMEMLPTLVREQLQNVADLTKDNTKGNLVLALSYGSQKEIVNATKNICKQVAEGNLKIEDINEQVFENNLYTKNIPPVDLLIRTSGEIRISNFLLWQLAYTEFIFIDKYWPDFNENDIEESIHIFQKRHRKFGAN